MNVRCVSGGRMPDQIYSDLNNGAVRDDRTNLVWQKCSVGQIWSPNSPDCTLGSATIHNFVSALYTCQSLNLADRAWRLPNVHELRSLLDFLLLRQARKLIRLLFRILQPYHNILRAIPFHMHKCLKLTLKMLQSAPPL